MDSWVEEFPSAITVCDNQGIILSMNGKSAKSVAKDGGKALIGTNLFDCHPGESGIKLKKVLEGQQKNIYTIEKNGQKKLIYQSPWYLEGQFQGFVELSIELPPNLPHFVRS